MVQNLQPANQSKDEQTQVDLLGILSNDELQTGV